MPDAEYGKKNGQVYYLVIKTGEVAHEGTFQCISYVHQIEVPTNTAGFPEGRGWRHSQSPLMQAAGQGDGCWINQTLEERADVTFPDHQGWFSLQYAARAGSEVSVQLLLQAGSDVDAPPAEYCGRTALQGAAEKGSRDGGRTALQAAARNGHNGADANAPSAEVDGRTALQDAVEMVITKLWSFYSVMVLTARLREFDSNSL
ncbi:MAG: hypothetical protein M1839_004485 [Geoglossum umbratile]|nr:MAG: hypothetical protein M1839_004485 [Geoglossum umbratile]